MPESPLQGVGVLVTRPRTQATELVNAVENAGGTAICFPVLEIIPFDELDVRNSVSRLGRPDICIFVSRNAVEHGIRYADDGAIAVIGPATARAVVAAGLLWQTVLATAGLLGWGLVTAAGLPMGRREAPTE